MMARTPDHDMELSEHLLDGSAGAGAVPAALTAVAALLEEARTVPPASAAPAGLVAAMAAAATSRPAEPAPQRKPMLAKFLTAKVAAAAFGAVALSSTGAAAATGNLPDAVQDRVAAAAQNVGVTLPSSASQTAKDVRAILDDDTLSGREKGRAVSDAARGEHGRPNTEGDGSEVEAEADGAQPASRTDNPGATSSEVGRATADAAKSGAADAGAANSEDGRATAEKARTNAPAPTPAPETPEGGAEEGDAAGEGASGFGTDTAAERGGNATAAEEAPVADRTPAASRPGGGRP